MRSVNAERYGEGNVEPGDRLEPRLDVERLDRSKDPVPWLDGDVKDWCSIVSVATGVSYIVGVSLNVASPPAEAGLDTLVCKCSPALAGDRWN